jgi:thiol-disulfide isomerase/thioredoxin
VVAVLAVVVGGCSSGGASDGASGGAASDQLLTVSVDEAVAYVEELEGPVVLNLWASWCPPCRDEAPLLAAAHRRYGDEVHFVGVDLEDTKDGAVKFMEAFGIEFPSLFDPQGEIARAFGLRGIPVTVVFDDAGDEVFRKVGIITEAELLRAIDDAAAA